MTLDAATERDDDELQNDYVIRPFVMPSFLNPSECDAILEEICHLEFFPGQLLGTVENYRVCEVALAKDTSVLLQQVADRLSKIVCEVNSAWYHFSLNGAAEPIQLIRYGMGGKIDWHTDCGPADVSVRKLSVTIPLSVDTAYCGGDLEFLPECNSRFMRRRGTALIFPSYLTHRVTPVSSGNRVSLVAWFHGPPFR